MCNIWQLHDLCCTPHSKLQQEEHNITTTFCTFNQFLRPHIIFKSILLKRAQPLFLFLILFLLHPQTENKVTVFAIPSPSNQLATCPKPPIPPHSTSPQRITILLLFLLRGNWSGDINHGQSLGNNKRRRKKRMTYSSKALYSILLRKKNSPVEEKRNYKSIKDD